MRKLLAILIAFALAAPVAFAAGGQRPSAKSILSQITKEGGRKVLWALWEQEELGPVVSGIESGDAAWLKVATQLRPYADGGASLSLDFAVARALPKAPEAVLAYVGHGLDIEYICTSPFIEPEPGVAEAYEQKALAALAKVTTPTLKALATECSKRVRLPDGTVHSSRSGSAARLNSGVGELRYLADSGDWTGRDGQNSRHAR